MSVQGNPFTVHDSSLVLCLDAVNLKSYIGSGTAWKNLSRASYDGVLVNGPTSNEYGLVLDGVNDYATISHGGDLGFGSGNFTISVWHRNENSSTGYNGIITNDNSSDNAWKIFRDSGQSYYRARCNSTTVAFPAYTVGKFHFYAYTFNSGTLYLYFDGVLTNSVGTVSNPVTSGNTNIAFGSYRYSDAIVPQFLTNQTIGIVMLYNRALSADEILQNYNAVKSRFRL